MRCEDKVALVTGAAGNGMGRSIALTLAREGAGVVVNYRTSADSAQAVVAHIAGRGGKALAYQADVTQLDQCQGLVDAAVETFGKVDICIIGPGAGWHPEPYQRPVVSSHASTKLASRVRRVIDDLDEQGRWVEPGRLRDRSADDPTEPIIDCRTFITNCRLLSRYLAGEPSP